MKILFELSLGINRVTNFLEIANLAALFILVIVKFTEIVLKTNEFKHLDLADTKTFHNFQMFVNIEQVYTISLTISSFFYPFRIFAWLAHFNTFTPARTIINTVARTAPGIGVYIICLMIMILGWAMGAYIILCPYYPEFNSFQRTIWSMVTSDLQAIQIYHDLQDEFFHNDMKLATIQFLFTLNRGIIYIFGISLAVNLYKQAISFEKGHVIIDP